MGRRQRIVTSNSEPAEELSHGSAVPPEEQTPNTPEDFLSDVSERVPPENKDVERAPSRRRRPSDSDIEIKRNTAEENREIKKAKTQRELAEQCAAIMGTACAGMAFITSHDFWQLDDVEQMRMGEAIAQAVPSMPQKQAEAMLKKVPLINLAMTAGLIFGGRVYMEMNIRKAIARGYVADKRNPYHNVPPAEPPANTNNGVTMPQPNFDIPNAKDPDPTMVRNNGTNGSVPFEIPGYNSDGGVGANSVRDTIPVERVAAQPDFDIPGKN